MTRTVEDVIIKWCLDIDIWKKLGQPPILWPSFVVVQYTGKCNQLLLYWKVQFPFKSDGLLHPVYQTARVDRITECLGALPYFCNFFTLKLT